MGDYPEHSGGPNGVISVLISERGRQEGQSQRRRCDEGSDAIAGHKPRNVGSLWKLEKTRKPNLPRASRRKAALLTPRP